MFDFSGRPPRHAIPRHATGRAGRRGGECWGESRGNWKKTDRRKLVVKAKANNEEELFSGRADFFRFPQKFELRESHEVRMVVIPRTKPEHPLPESRCRFARLNHAGLNATSGVVSEPTHLAEEILKRALKHPLKD